MSYLEREGIKSSNDSSKEKSLSSNKFIQNQRETETNQTKDESNQAKMNQLSFPPSYQIQPNQMISNSMFKTLDSTNKACNEDNSNVKAQLYERNKLELLEYPKINTTKPSEKNNSISITGNNIEMSGFSPQMPTNNNLFSSSLNPMTPTNESENQMLQSTLQKNRKSIITVDMKSRLKNRQNQQKIQEKVEESKSLLLQEKYDTSQSVQTEEREQLNQFINQKAYANEVRKNSAQGIKVNLTDSMKINLNDSTKINLTESQKLKNKSPRLTRKGTLNQSGGWSNKIFPETRQMRPKQTSVFSQQSNPSRQEDDNNNLLEGGNNNFQIGITNKHNNNIILKVPILKQHQSSNAKSNQEIPISPKRQQKPALSSLQSKSHGSFFSFFTRHFEKHNSQTTQPQSTAAVTNNNSLIQNAPPTIIVQSQIPLQGIQNSMGSQGVLPPVSEINPGTNWNFVKKLAKVKKFIDSIKTSNLYKSFYKVKGTHLQLIADKADFTLSLADINDLKMNKKNRNKSNNRYSNSPELKNTATLSLKQRFFFSITNYIEEQVSKIPLFLPHQPLLNWFKMAMLIISVITLIFVPLIGCFELTVEHSSPEEYILFIIPIILFGFEIIINFNTAYYEEGDIQMSRIKILKQYSMTYFCPDLFSSVALYLLMKTGNAVFVLLFLFRVLKIPAYRRDINEYFYIQQRANTLYTLVNLILSVMILSHYFACGFNEVAIVEEKYYGIQSWVQQLNIDATSKWSRYINSIYFSFITMVTVGFGDIKPMTDPEKIYVTLVAIVSSLVFAYTVNTIGTVFQEIAQQEAEYKSQKYHLSVYMRSRSINQRLQTRAMKYLDHMIHKQLESPQKGQDILKKMSNKVRDEIYKDFFGKILLDSKMFKFNFSESFLKELTLSMKEIICRPGELVFSINEADNRIFFINKGEVELFLEKTKKKDEQDIYSFDILNKGDIFGEQSFFTSKLRETSAKCLSVSHLVFCTYEDFIEVLKQFPKDYEKFCQMKDEVMNYGEQLSTRCAVCSKFRHSIVNCPYIHLIRRPENVIHRHIRSIPNERSKHFRQKVKKQNTLLCNEKVRIQLRQLRRQLVNKAQKKPKDDSILEENNTNANGYHINVKRMEDSDDDTIYSETRDQIKRKTDRKFFLSMPKVAYDLQKMISIDNDDDEQLEDDEDQEYLHEDDEEEYEDQSDQILGDEDNNDDSYNDNRSDNNEMRESDDNNYNENEDEDDEENEEENGEENDEVEKQLEGDQINNQREVNAFQNNVQQENYQLLIENHGRKNNQFKQEDDQVSTDINQQQNDHQKRQSGLKLNILINNKQIDTEQKDEDSQYSRRRSSRKGTQIPPLDMFRKVQSQDEIREESSVLIQLTEESNLKQQQQDNNLNNEKPIEGIYDLNKINSLQFISSQDADQEQRNSEINRDEEQSILNENNSQIVDKEETESKGTNSERIKNYKQQNKLIFKNSIFSLKIADLASSQKKLKIPESLKQFSSKQSRASSIESFDLKQLNILQLNKIDSLEKQQGQRNSNQMYSINVMNDTVTTPIKKKENYNEFSKYKQKVPKDNDFICYLPRPFKKKEGKKQSVSKRQSEFQISGFRADIDKLDCEEKSESSSRNSTTEIKLQKFTNQQELKRKSFNQNPNKNKFCPIPVLNLNEPLPPTPKNHLQKKILYRNETPQNLKSSNNLEFEIRGMKKRNEKRGRISSMVPSSNSTNNEIYEQNNALNHQESQGKMRIQRGFDGIKQDFAATTNNISITSQQKSSGLNLTANFPQTTSAQQQLFGKNLSVFNPQHDFSSAWLFTQASQKTEQQQQLPKMNLLTVPSNNLTFGNENSFNSSPNPNTPQISIQIPSPAQQNLKKQYSIQGNHHQNQGTYQNNGMPSTRGYISSPMPSTFKNQTMQLQQQQRNQFGNPLNPQQQHQQQQQQQQQQQAQLNQQNIQGQQSQQSLTMNNQPNVVQNLQSSTSSQQQISSSLLTQQQQLLQQLQQLASLSHQGTLGTHAHNSLSTQNFTLENNNLIEENFVGDYNRNHKMLFYYDIDKMKEFTNYFPHNNYSLVCKEKKKIVNRKNLFAAKLKLGNSSRNLGFKSGTNNLQSHPSPRGMLTSQNLGQTNNISNPINKLYSTILQVSSSQSQNLQKDTNQDGVSVEQQRIKLKKATETIFLNKIDSKRENSMNNITIKSNNNQNPIQKQGEQIISRLRQTSRISSIGNISNFEPEIQQKQGNIHLNNQSSYGSKNYQNNILKSDENKLSDQKQESFFD